MEADRLGAALALDEAPVRDSERSSRGPIMSAADLIGGSAVEEQRCP